MAANNTILNGPISNFTHAEELGWQAVPRVRGTASILWSCASVIFLITWTNFHFSVGITWKQRMYTAIMAILLPQTSAFVAGRDYQFAYRLHQVLTRFVDLPGWRFGWTMQKSFVVVQRGIRAGQCVTRHPSIDYEDSEVIELGEIIDTDTYGRHFSGSRLAQSADIEPDEIITPETFLLLVLTGRIRYEDFPSTEEIDDKSNADWFSKAATLFQLVWFVINLGCRMLSPACDVSLLEFLTIDWIMFGITAAGLWWRSPQNIKTPFYVPVQDCLMAAGATSTDHDPDLHIGAMLDHITGYRDYIDDYLERFRRHEDQHQSRWSRPSPPPGLNSGLSIGVMIMLSMIVLAQTLINFPFYLIYQWHSTPPGTLWILFTVLALVAEIVIGHAEHKMRSNWGVTSIYETYIRPLRHGPPPTGKEHETASKCLAMAGGMGIYDADDLEQRRRTSDWKRDIYWLKVAAAAAFVVLLCHVGKLVIALTAFISAPDRIYKVPDIAVLEAIGHVGG